MPLKHSIMIVVLVFFTFTTCSPQNNSTSVRKTLLVLFDPTVFTQNSKNSFDKLMDDFQSLFVNIPVGVTFKLWLIENNMINRDLFYTYYFKGYEYSDDADKYKTLLKDEFLKLRLELDKSWKKYHMNDYFTRPTSCIISSICMLSRKNTELHNGVNKNNGKEKISLLVISDLVEMCEDWKIPTVISDEYFKKISSLKLSVSTNLSLLSRLIFVKLSNDKINSIENYDILESFWRKFAESCQIKKEAVKYETSIPSVDKIFD